VNPGDFRITGMARWLRHRAGLYTSPLSIGVRAYVEDGDGAVLLVKHTYIRGWHFPGGGVDPGETAQQAVDRELGAIARPGQVHFVSLLPKTRSGKLLRRSIQALAEGRDPGDLTTIEDPAALEQIRSALSGAA